MGSGCIAGVATAELGVIPRSVAHIFSLLARVPVTETWAIRISYLEIHNEEVKDLLHPHAPARAVTVRSFGPTSLCAYAIRLGLSYNLKRRQYESSLGESRLRANMRAEFSSNL